MKSKIYQVVFILFFLNATIAFAVIIDLKKSQLLLKEEKYEEVLTILSPCLLSSKILPHTDLEECLYIGEFAAKKLEDNMWSAGMKDDERDKKFKYFGLKPIYNHHNGPIYNHDYFHQLKKLFPNSKYKDEFSYALIEQGNYPGGWKTWETGLMEYLKEFPNGRYFTQAKLDLAHISDSLWAVLCCDELYREDFTTGYIKRDIEMAEAYRLKAIKLYDEVIKEANSNPDAISSYDLEETKSRVIDLRERKHWNKTWVIND